MTTANVVDVSEYQPTTIDFNDLKANGVKAVIVRLGHGTTQDKNAASHLARSQQAGLLVHGYHYYEGLDGEAAWSIKNAQELGLSTNAYYFLDMEGEISGSWSDIFRGFYRNWLQAGYCTGLYCSLSKYSLFSDNELTSNHVYRWIADWDVDQAPENTDVWQYNCSTGLGQYQDKLDKDVDLTGQLIEQQSVPSTVTDPNGNYPIKAGAFVGFDFSTTSLSGGKMLVASPDGVNKVPKLDPKGNFLFNNHDYGDIWANIKPHLPGTIDSSSQNTSKKPSEYLEGFFHEVKDVSAIGIARTSTEFAPEDCQGSTAFVTTMSYGGMVHQTADIVDSEKPMRFCRNGKGDTWYRWEWITTE